MRELSVIKFGGDGDRGIRCDQTLKGRGKWN